MKTCSVCGLHVEDDYIYCWEDGTRLNEADLRLPSPRPSPETGPVEWVVAPSRENEETEGQSVLYCPVCTGAFPLTFVACPIDHLPLTTKSFSRKAAPQIHVAPVEEPALPIMAAAQIHVAPVEEPAARIMTTEDAVQFSHRATTHFGESTTEIRSRNWTDETSNSETYSLRSLTHRWLEFRDRTKHLWQQIKSNRNSAKRHGRSPDWSLDFVRSEEPDNVPKGMRLAARAIAIALILITLAGIYLLYSQVTRTPSRSSRVSQSNIAQPESPLIVTPQEAREYRAEPEPPASAGTDEEGARTATDRTPQLEVARLDQAPRTALAAPARSGVANLAASSFGSRPVSGGGRFNTQLVRVRSYRSSSGYRYTLTFTLYEQAGRPMRWERLSVVTHSANGATHSESIPFQYVLAGSGALTFTVNVEMAGTSEEDWRGHISCTSVGADDSGRPLRASFGADVAP